MAYVVKYPTSKYWVAAFRDASGKQHRRSTREVDRKRALAVALAYERVAKGKGSPQRVRQVLSEFMRDHFGQDLPSASVRDFFERWLAARRTETSPATFRRYGDAIRAFLSFLGPRAARGLDEVTREQITGFRDSLLARLAPATTNGYAKLIRRIFRSARQDGFIIVDPAESVKAVQGRRAPKPASVLDRRIAFDSRGCRSRMGKLDQVRTLHRPATWRLGCPHLGADRSRA